MDRPAIESKVRELVHQQGVVLLAEVELTSRLDEDLALDSLDQVELMFSVEEEFDLEITNEDAEAWTTVADVVAYVERRTQPSAKAG